MRPYRRPVLAAASFAAALPAFGAGVQLNVSGEARQEINTPQFQDRYQSLASYLGANLGTDVKLAIGRDLSRELQKMRAGLYEVLVGPAHVIVYSVRDRGYCRRSYSELSKSRRYRHKRTGARGYTGGHRTSHRGLQAHRPACGPENHSRHPAGVHY